MRASFDHLIMLAHQRQKNISRLKDVTGEIFCQDISL